MAVSLRSWLVLACVIALASCVVLTTDPRAVIYGPDGLAVRTLTCKAAVEAVRAWAPSAPAAGALDPSRIRLLTWNIHKEDDDGWREDLARFAAENDLLLLQEVRLIDALTDILSQAGLRWGMASSFIYQDVDIGVVTASRAPSVAQCTQRVTEPIIRLPKSSVVTWLPIAGSTKTLAVANMHSINFALTLGAYEQQFAEIAQALAEHDGPVILAGDLNTWTDARLVALRELGARLGLTEIPFESGRSRFYGHELDHILIRGLTVESATAISVKSSDHNPVTAVLRVAK